MISVRLNNLDNCSAYATIEEQDSTVGKHRKFFERLMRGSSDHALRFDDLCMLLTRLGFEERVRGDHHIFTKEGVVEIINLQPKGFNAKPYQVKQIRYLIQKYGIRLEDGDE